MFLVDDTVHPEVKAVYNYLEQLVLEMRKLGYVPDTKFVLHDMEEAQKESILYTPSEKLAVVFGLMKLPLGATIRVFKNLKICGDCHNAFKFMSKVVGREIIVRDGRGFIILEMVNVLVAITGSWIFCQPIIFGKLL